MRLPRASGILLHPTSLPGDFGIGDFGAEAFKFIDFLADAHQAYWQILPLGPTGYGDSPYQSFSAFAGNILMISPERLIEGGLLPTDIVASKPNFPVNKADFGTVYKWKTEILSKAYEEFHHVESGELNNEFETFSQRNQFWLDDYALYRALKVTQEQKPWYEWPDKFKLRDERTLRIAADQLSKEVQAEKFYQFLFFRQWRFVKDYAAQHEVKIIGDIPIFVALDSADVWCNQNQFKLNLDGSAKVVSGVPPDFFSKTGQLWGNPIYDWDAMRRDDFKWWVSRFRFTFQMVDIARVDHFRGFLAAWEVPGTDATAENGQWVEVPGRDLFTTLKQNLGDLPVIAEDLGVITPDVEELRDSFAVPGMRVLQFAFGGDARNRDLPHNYNNNCVAYTGTHDNDTALGWWHSLDKADSTHDETAVSHEHEFCLRYLNTEGREINWDLIRAIWSSVADTAIVPLQDILGLGNEARMNLPATTSGNWSWRFEAEAITDEIIARLRKLTDTYGRNQ
jgi:4-alpha-glucanotransferase